MQVIYKGRKFCDVSAIAIASTVVAVIQSVDGIVLIQQRINEMLITSRMFGVTMGQDHHGSGCIGDPRLTINFQSISVSKESV